MSKFSAEAEQPEGEKEGLNLNKAALTARRDDGSVANLSEVFFRREKDIAPDSGAAKPISDKELMELPLQARGPIAWRGRSSYSELIKEVKESDRKGHNFKDRNFKTRIYGASRKERQFLKSALKYINAGALQKLGLSGGIFVADDVGVCCDPKAIAGAPVQGFNIDGEGRWLIDRSIFQGEPAHLRSLVYSLLAIESRVRGVPELISNRTMLAVNRLSDKEEYRAPDSQARHGYRVYKSKEYPLLGRDTSVIGKAYHGGNARLAVLIDDKVEDSHELRDFKRRFLIKLFTRVKRDENDPYEVMSRLKKYIQTRLPYTTDAEKQVMDKFDVAKDDLVPLDYFLMIDRPGGVCNLQGVAAAYLAERLSEGRPHRLDLKLASLDRNEIPGYGIHAWSRILLRDNSVWIIDPAQDYVGPPEYGYWPYMRESDIAEIRERPRPLTDFFIRSVSF